MAFSLPQDPDALSPYLGIPLIAILLLLNAMFVATEFAYVTVRRSRIENLAEEGNASARAVRSALGNLDYWVAASQLGITVASIALGWIGEPVFAALVEPPVERVVGSFAPSISHVLAIMVAFITITALHIVIGEFVPKSIALQQPEVTSLRLVQPIRMFVRVFGWAVWMLNATANGLLRLFGMSLRPLQEEPLGIEDLALTIESSASAGLISRLELDLSRNLLRLSRLEARELMIPRNKVVAVAVTATASDVLRTLATHRFTRYPVYRDTIDDVIGVIDADSRLDSELELDLDWHEDIKQLPVRPETAMVDDVLDLMQGTHTPMVLLIDEFGGTAGIITEFDIVISLAGDLPEGQDGRLRRIHRNEDGSFTLSGLVPITMLEEEFGIETAAADVITTGGLVTALLQRIPSLGDRVRIDGLSATVIEMDRHRVARLRLESHDEPGSDTTERSRKSDEI